MTKADIKQNAWDALNTHAQNFDITTLPHLFAKDSQRFEKLSFQLGPLLADFSKNLINDNTLPLLLNLAEEKNLTGQIHDMFTGKKINTTEDRAVLHTALRTPHGTIVKTAGENVIPGVHKTLKRLYDFADDVRTGKWRGHTGAEITDVVNIGIGGSVLGAQLVTEALSGFAHMRIRTHFISNVEASELHRVLQPLSPKTTLFIIASKTFTTAETMQNAAAVREKVLKHFDGDETVIAKHFVALSTNIDGAKDFGIAERNIFPFWDWVGGRYSVWSAIGLAAIISIGSKNFQKFLDGAHEIDMHFKTAPLAENIPVLMGLIGIWYRNFIGFNTYAAIPYHSSLRRFPAWLQQADMESNGKSVNKNGTAVDHHTGPIVFGEPGTDSQHSFFQWLHQGTSVVPVDFIAAVKNPYGTKKQQHMLLANCLAQSEALMNGSINDNELHRNFSGSRPSTTILLDELNPRTLGMLLALYEHRVFVQGAIWNINSFDQFGVELGKVLAKTIQNEIDSGNISTHDSSTTGLMKHIKDKEV